MTIELQDDFSRRKVRSLGRLCAYTLLLVFLASVITALLPPPFASPQRMLAVITEVLERSTLPAVAVLFLFFGFSGDSLPALWECWLARWLRPLLRLAALLYLLTAVAVVGVGQRLTSDGVASLEGQLRTSIENLGKFRQQVDGETSVERLRALVARQPQILQALQQEGTPLDQNSPLPELRQQVDRLLTRLEANLQPSEPGGPLQCRRSAGPPDGSAGDHGPDLCPLLPRCCADLAALVADHRGAGAGGPPAPAGP